MLKIENEYVNLEVALKGAEMISLKDKETAIEYMWSGDSTYWAGRSPILFPIVGSTWDKKIHLDGKEFEMRNHGLVREAIFKLEEELENKIVLSYESNEDTLAKYPFDFKLWVEYSLSGRRVEVRYRIENKSSRRMPFSFGLHPAFNCPLQHGDKFEDYTIEFSHEETLDGCCGPLGMKKEKTIPLSYSLFEENETICFENPKSTSVQLTNGKHGVKVNLIGYRWIAFWTPKAGTPFLCIEPWHGHDDFEKVDVAFENREGTLHLEEGRSYLTSLGIEIY